jgi:hypothetical protein
MKQEGRAAGEGERSLPVFLSELDAEMPAAFFGFFEQAFRNVVVMNVNRADFHGDGNPSLA